MKNYFGQWAEGWLKRSSMLPSGPISVIGEREKHFGPKSEFAKVKMTVYPSSAFEIIDATAETVALEKLGVGWPDSAIFGLLDVLMLAEPNPLYKVRIVLEAAWYHDVDSSWNAFRHAGRDAGRKILDRLGQPSRHDEGYEIT
jgi:translation elongation factor EF-G